MTGQFSDSARRVQDVLEALGLPCRVVELPASTRTAQEAAQAIGCQLGQIVKSLIFMTQETRHPILILASGVNRVDEKRIGQTLGETLARADPDFVRLQTGFAIGGIPPVGLANRMRTFIDQDLLLHPSVWAAAGTPHAVFELDPAKLPEITSGEIVKINT